MIYIIEAIVISLLVGVGCYQWGYSKAVEKQEKLHKEKIDEIKKEHKEEISNLWNRINNEKKEQD